jgi:hypothetical protein
MSFTSSSAELRALVLKNCRTSADSSAGFRVGTPEVVRVLEAV